MHITLDKIDLEKKLDLVSRISAKHQTLPILQCVLFVVDDTVRMRATNLEIGIEATPSAEIQEKGTVAIPSQILYQTIQLLPHGTVTLKTEGDVLTIASQGTKTEIKTFASDEFPAIPQIESTPHTLNGELFALGVKTAAFSASQSSIKPELGSIYLYQKKEHALTCVATDSFRLMEKTVSQKNLVLEEGIMVPRNNALELARVCELLEGDPKFYVSENQCALLFEDGTYITSRLTEGSFPDYEGIIPKEFASHATVLTQDFVHALKKANIFTNRFMQVSLSLDTQKKQLMLSSQNSDVGQTEEEISATIEGEDIALNFNQRYLAEPMQHTSDESITLHFAGVGRPVVFTGVSDNSFRYLVMPMNK